MGYLLAYLAFVCLILLGSYAGTGVHRGRGMSLVAGGSRFVWALDSPGWLIVVSALPAAAGVAAMRGDAGLSHAMVFAGAGLAAVSGGIAAVSGLVARRLHPHLIAAALIAGLVAARWSEVAALVAVATLIGLQGYEFVLFPIWLGRVPMKRPASPVKSRTPDGVAPEEPLAPLPTHMILGPMSPRRLRLLFPFGRAMTGMAAFTLLFAHSLLFWHWPPYEQNLGLRATLWVVLVGLFAAKLFNGWTITLKSLGPLYARLAKWTIGPLPWDAQSSGEQEPPPPAPPSP